MADDDEIDVLGDFSLDNLLSKQESGISSCYENSVPHNSELLNCDYSSWLIDHGVPASGDAWYSNSNNDYSSVSPSETSLGFDEVICSENKAVEEPLWTADEKNLLEKGLAMYGRNCLRLSQYIETKTPGQVRHYLDMFGVYEEHENNNQSATKNDETALTYKMSDLIEDAQIPASIEEVIAAVSTAKPTVQIHKKINDKSSHKHTGLYSHPAFSKTHLSSGSRKNKVESPLIDIVKKRRLKKVVTKPRIRMKQQNDYTINEELAKEEQKNKKVIPVSSGEQLVKITKENENSDEDSDIEIDIDEEKPESNSVEEKAQHIHSEDQCTTQEDKKALETETQSQIETVNIIKNVDENLLKILNSLDVPTSECILKEDGISDLEKFVHSEFFEGRVAKTPSRYLKIRNYIVDYWSANRPNYCTKTAVRLGLKNCGDVNCIGRIHQYLEQIGAINFGCSQVQYIRPLLKMVIANANSACGKEKQKCPKVMTIFQQRCEFARGRVKKKYNNDGEGGYTMIHNEKGDIIDTTIVNHDKQNKPRTYRKNIKLVPCKSFTPEYPAPYRVKLNIEALFIVDLHAHSALVEVMGLLGGTYSIDKQELCVTRYVPCRNIDHSNTHCDMCPVSQSEASEIIQSEGLEVIGWFHSHPTFYPNPSLQDIETQLSMQEYLSNSYSPFIGVILSPFRSFTNALMSEYRCLIVDKSPDSTEASGVPYKFITDLYSDNLDINKLMRHAQYIFSMKNNIPAEFVVDFNKPYFQHNHITYLEKFISSVRIHLARCSNINKMTCDAVTEVLTNVCLTNTINQKIVA